MKIKKIFVTGATGFIGSNLVKELVEKKYDVYILIKQDSKLKIIDEIINKIHIFEYDGNIQNLVKYFEEVKFDLVIHLASLFLSEHKTQDIDDLIKSNILLGTQILEAMVKSNTFQIINTATSWQHYNDESYNPVCLYAATKQAFEDILKFYVEVKNIKAITLTIFDTYGDNDTRKKLIPKLYEISESKEFLDMSMGEQYVDYIYIKDIIEAYLTTIKLMEEVNVENKLEKYYLNSDEPKTIKDVVNIFEKVNNVKLNIRWGKRLYRKREIMNTYKLGKRLPNWYPKYNLEKGFNEIKINLNKNKKRY